MLTSSDAKFRCLWYMVVWSVLLMFVSQFFRLTDHIAFYIFATAAMLVLPFVTSLYSTTSGRRGAGLLRVSYIFCDPVLACVSVIPVLLLHHLPRLFDDFLCFEKLVSGPDILPADNSSLLLTCGNYSGQVPQQYSEMSGQDRSQLHDKQLYQIAVVQLALLAPPLLTLAMGRRSPKMSFSTVVFAAFYWLVVAIETADLISMEVISKAAVRRQAAASTAAIVALAMILSNSYAVVTLCSYICPSDRDREETPTKKQALWFDGLYRCLLGGVGVLFAEIPLLASHVQILTVSQHVSSTFYAWTVKDVVFILVAVISVIYYAVGSKRDVMGASCGRLAFDNPDVFFLPEKRDAYIVRHHNIHRQSIATDFSEADLNLGGEPSDKECHESKKKKRVSFRFELHHGRHGNNSHSNESSNEKGVDSTVV